MKIDREFLTLEPLVDPSAKLHVAFADAMRDLQQKILAAFGLPPTTQVSDLTNVQTMLLERFFSSHTLVMAQDVAGDRIIVRLTYEPRGNPHTESAHSENT